MNTEAKLDLILTREEKNRLKINDKEEKITVDLHGMKVKEAKKFINNLININRNRATITCIHGYNHGTAIRNMIETDLNSPRIKEKQVPDVNPGITKLMISAA